MANLAGVVGLALLAAGAWFLVAGDRMEAVDCFVIAALALAVWGVGRKRKK